jgi:hypothetical protein
MPTGSTLLRFPQRYSHRFSQFFPQVAALSALALLLAGCAGPGPVDRGPPTARAQAAPLPVVERVPTTPGATPRQRIVEIALHEWRRWGAQTIRIGRDDTACITASPLPVPVPAPVPTLLTGDPLADAGLLGHGVAGVEGHPSVDDAPAATTCPGFPDGTGMEATAQGCQMAQAYWAIVGKTPDCYEITQGRWAWSAVFISWVLRQAGLDERQFLTGESHSMYVVDARDGILPAPAFRIEPVPAVPRPGDIVCAGRGRDKYIGSPAEVSFGTTPMHCDIVVEVDATARVVKTIGGNLQQSVSMEVIELGDSGRIDGLTNSHMPWLLVMRNQLP